MEHKSGNVEFDKSVSLDFVETLFEGQNSASLAEFEQKNPALSLRTDLIGFQKQGLAWLIRMEHPALPELGGDPVQFWTKHEDQTGEVCFLNIVTETQQSESPIIKRGGILADGTKLGKTIQMIALIMSQESGEGVIDPPQELDDRFHDMNLIVCPSFGTSDWINQLKTHVGSDKKRLKWHLYSGEGTEISMEKLLKVDVVITTYQTVALEWGIKREKRKTSRKGSFLDKIKWRRIVLDEGHLIRNPNSDFFMACSALTAERRWILTESPIVNSASDLGSMVAFLRLCQPLNERSQRDSVVGSKSESEQVQLLRAILSVTTLRRMEYMFSIKNPLEFQKKTDGTFIDLLRFSKLDWPKSIKSGITSAPLSLETQSAESTCAFCERTEDLKRIDCIHFYCIKCINYFIKRSKGCYVCIKPKSMRLEDVKDL